MTERKIINMKIADIVIGERFRKNFYDIDELVKSIEEFGLLQPVLIDSENKLVAGERRIRAFQFLGKEHIDTIIIPIDQIADREYLEFAENNIRSDFTVSEKVDIAIAVEKKVKELGERRGKKAQSIDNNKDAKSGYRPDLGEETRDFVARRAGFKSSRSYRDAREATEKAIPEVIAAMDRQDISINCAHDICQLPKKKQLTALNDATKRPDVDTTELNKSQTSRRKAKRLAKTKTPSKYKSHRIFNIIRVAPDWANENLDDIEELPVPEYVAETQCILAIEVDALRLYAALEFLTGWGFAYYGMYTVWDPKHVGDVPALATRYGAHYIVIGIRNGEKKGDYKVTIDKRKPVLARYNDVAGSLLQILNEIFPNKADRRIDMTSPVKPKGWIAWKTSYGISKDPEDEPDDELPDEPEISEESVEPEAAEHGESEPVETVTEKEIKLLPDEDEIFEPEKKKLRLF